MITQVLWLDEERVSSTVASDVEAGLSTQLPQQTSPHPSFATEVRTGQLEAMVTERITCSELSLECPSLFFRDCFEFICWQGRI